MDLGGCVVTYDRSKLEDAEAVVFHYTALDEEVMPWQHYRCPWVDYDEWNYSNLLGCAPVDSLCF